MKAMKKAALALVTASAIGTGFAMWGIGTASGQATTTTAKLTAAEQAGLSFSRDEERMARDLYRLFADKYGTGPFAMISAGEQRHFDAVGALLTRYGVSDPAAGAKAGSYADPAVQKLYDGWKASGLGSLKAAYQVGVDLEKRDVADLKRLAGATGNADLDRVYGRLETGSEHHLAAFTAAAAGKTVPGAGLGAQRGRHGGPGMGQGGMGQGRGVGQGRGMGAGNGDCPFD